MKTTRFFMAFLFMIAFSPLSLAQQTVLDFKGQWSGKGTYIYDGHLTQCSVMKLEFFADSNTFAFKGGERVCEEHSEKFYEVFMNYENGLVKIAGDVVGTYKDNEMNVAFSAPDPAGGIRHWRMSMRVEGDHLIYEESRTMNDDTTPLISFAGMLIRQ